MLIYLVLFLYVVICTYVLLRLIDWLNLISPYFANKNTKRVIILVYIVICSAVIVTAFLPYGNLRKIAYKIDNYWEGILWYAVIFLTITDMVCFIMSKYFIKQKEYRRGIIKPRLYFFIGLLIVSFSLFFTHYGFTNAKDLTTVYYGANIDKNIDIKDNKLRLTLISDLHLGYETDEESLIKLVNEINNTNPDIVIIAGDLFDNCFEKLENPDKFASIFSEIKSTYGVYGAYGNHDVQEELIAGFSFFPSKYALRSPKMTEFVNEAGFIMLEDKIATVCNDQVVIVGRRDAVKSGDGYNNRVGIAKLLENVDKRKLIIVISHEPNELKYTADAGADLLLCGHTHNGQFFPLTVTQHLFWENAYGMLKVGNMYNFVTAGAGVYCPSMRIGSKTEIMQITINIKN